MFTVTGSWDDGCLKEWDSYRFWRWIIDHGIPNWKLSMVLDIFK